MNRFEPFFWARKGRVSDRYGRSLRPARSYDLGIELLCKGLDDAGSESAFRLRENTVRLAHAVIDYRQTQMRHCTSVNFEIPGSMLSYLPGMTVGCIGASRHKALVIRHRWLPTILIFRNYS